MPKPLVSYAGIPIPAQRVPWSFLPGLRPHTLTFKVARGRGDELVAAAAAKGNIADLVVESSFGGFGEETPIKVTIENVVLSVADGTSSPWDQVLTLHDDRYWLAGELVTASFNVPRTTNDRGAEAAGELAGAASAHPVSEGGTKQVSTGGGSGSVGLGPAPGAGGAAGPPAAALVEGRDRDILFPAERYLAWSLKDGKAPATAKWIAEQLLEQVALKNEGSPRARVARAIKAAIEPLADNGYWEDNVAPRREDAVTAIETQLERAEIGVAVGHKEGESGSLYAWNTRGETVALADGAQANVDELLDVIAPLYPPVQAGGFMDVRRNLLRRPARVAVEHPAEWELRVECQDVWSATYEDKLSPYAQNVVKLPQDVRLAGKLYRKGTWMILDDALTAWNADGTLPLAGNPWSRVPLTRTRIRELWFPAGKLEVAYTYEVVEGGVFKASSIWGPRINAILDSFRQVWRINPPLYDYVLSMEPRRSRIVDPRSRTFAPAFVAMDHCVIPNVTLPEFHRRRGRAGANITCWDDDATVATGAAHLVLGMEDRALGVVRLGGDITKKVAGERVGSIIPSQVDNLPVLAGAAMMADRLWSNAKLMEAFKAYFIVTVTWAMHPDKLAKTRLATPGMAGDAEGLNARLVHDAPAGAEVNPLLSLTLAESRVTARRIGFGDKKAALANPDTLRSLGDARAEDVYARLRDKLIGRYELPGWSDAYRLFGTVASLDLLVQADGRIHTIWDITTPPKARDEILRMPAALRQALAKRLGDAGGNAAAVGK